MIWGWHPSIPDRAGGSIAPLYNPNLCLCMFLLLLILLFMQLIVNSQLILTCIQIHFRTQIFRVHKLLYREAKLLYKLVKSVHTVVWSELTVAAARSY